MIKNIFLSTLISFLLVTSLYGQSTTDRKVGLAQSYEQVGQIDNALRLYKEVYNKDKKQNQAYEGLVRIYKYKNMNVELLTLLEDRVMFDERAVNFILLGEARWKAGLADEADKAWEIAIDKEPKNKFMYVDLAEIQSNLSLYQKAIKTYEVGRTKIENNGRTPFVDELSKLYIAVGNIELALKESLILLKENGALAAVEGRIYAMMQEESNLDLIDNTLEEFVNHNDNNYMSLELFSWYQTTIGNHERALEYTIKADNVSNSGGRMIINYAASAEQSGNTEASLKAYQHIIDQGKTNKFFSTAIYSYTRTLESKFLFDKNMTLDNADEIIDRYRTIIKEFPNSTTAADAYIQIARLQKENFGKYEEAEETLYELIKEIPGAIQSGTAMARIAEINMSRGELKEASSLLSAAKIRYGRNDKNLKELIDYKLALIQYYSGNLDSAETLFGILSEVKDTDIANDVLEKNSIVADKHKEEQKTKFFASAEFDLVKLDSSAAIDKFEIIINELSNYDTEIWQRSHLILSDIFLSKMDIEKSNFYLQEFISNLPDGVHTDKALFKLGSNKVTQSENEKAIEIFSRILIDFPNSIYLDRARLRIRELRGES